MENIKEVPTQDTKNVNAEKKQSVKKQSVKKQSVKNESVKNESVKIYDFKNFNLEKIAPKTNKGANKQLGKYIYLENEVCNGSTRSKFRTILDRLVDNILFYAYECKKDNKNKENSKLFLQSVIDFNVNYKMRYVDSVSYSLESFINSNSKDSRSERLKEVLNIIKTFKLQNVVK